ncbi:TRAP transporter small permease [Terrihabitans rhizophilus]|uniref:TRAP transporter small permease protein n=1 Tax=Terrihabitans rhizophilus TaxID=3092662 RepID=A0ABU4RMA7_9HYPH|nr:TRAP transporter small permease [Terrihabitans sp. PJ23]MDX6805952.1 TRAP transporter small permease [Terrihabitans sp. PJ23]
MNADNPVLKTLTPIARLLALLAGYLLLGLAILVTAEILLRRFMNISLQGGDEFGGYVLAILAAFGFSYALIERAHTRVEILVERVGWRTQSLLNLVSSWCIAVMAAFMAWRAYATLDESLEFQSLSGTPLMTPLWQPQGIWFVGLLFFGVVATAIAVHSTLLILRDPRRLNRLYGIKTLDEIIEEETVITEDNTGAIKP